MNWEVIAGGIDTGGGFTDPSGLTAGAGEVLPATVLHSYPGILSQRLDNLIARLSFLLAYFLHFPPGSLYQPVNCAECQH